ncbi:NAD(P)H-dependent oxidoreductase [Flammeovirga agarivorans]|uniref:NAD(P)H-dependent oxidoreductase n=1 Tax=Flammeovirga agarivorans TaxID=2726742 RepID=A0A7X8XY70_9BACT|nr:NAD(P)H-dependent oxidoreductase [Flammeovirga agarivorans]NLR93843.1 NAD(P)H-dependent oxidoreductase [Flammeovirga agarivorans]
MKKILIINGHPDPESFNKALADAYHTGVKKADAEVSVLNIGELEFNPNLEFGYRKRTSFEPDLEMAIEKIKWADHLVWIYPMWWSSMPAKLKGFIDRTFLPGITFDYVEGKVFPKKLLKGKTGRLIVTADSPHWYHRIIIGNPIINQMKKGILQFCGVNPVKVTYIATIRKSTEKFRQDWLSKVEAIGYNDV